MYFSPTTKIVLDPKNRGEKKRVKIRITYKRVSRFRVIRNNTLLTEGEFSNPNLKKTKIVLKDADECKTIADEIIAELGSRFSFEEFCVRYNELVFNKRVVEHINDISAVFAEYFSTHDLAVSSKEGYNLVLNAIKEYKPDCVITDIDEPFLQGLKSFLIKRYKDKYKDKEISKNTLGIYFRELKAVYNFAKKKNHLTDNPFENFHLQSVPRQKKSLTLEEFRIIVLFDSEDKSLMFARDMFLLSFLLGGANIGDIISLKNSNILGTHLSFRRQKTKKTGIIIEMEMPEEAIEIIGKYGKLEPTKPNEYIFPFLVGAKNENTLRERKKALLKKINKGLEHIGSVSGLGKITSYNARHTYATFVRGKIGDSQIQKILGHASLKTTEEYLDSLTTEEQKQNKGAVEQVMRAAREGVSHENR